jgi:undecaprenyl-diphosphatase
VNYHLFQLVNGWAGHNDVVDDLMEWIATWLIYVNFAAAAAAGGWALSRRRAADASMLVAALVLAFSVAWVIGQVSAEQRPFQGHVVHQLVPHAAGVSMPSDHATAAFTMAAAVGVFVSRRWGAVLAAPALAVGFARIWVGVHYPADIVVALIVALLAVAVVAVVSSPAQLRRVAALRSRR